MSSGIGEAIGGTEFGGGSGPSRDRSSSRWGREEDLSERAGKAWEETQDRGSRALSQMEHSAEDAFYATRRYVYHHPVQALLGVTAVAFAVGALWRLGTRERRFGQDLFDRFSDYVEPQVKSMRRSSWRW